MKLMIVAVGLRVPDWAQTAWDDYAKRFPPELKVELKAVKTEPRGSRTLETLYAAERARIEAAIPKGSRIVALDERGISLGTQALATKLKAKNISGDQVAQASVLYRDKVRPAIERQMAFMKGLQPKAVHDAGIGRLPDSQAYYELALRQSTTTKLSPAEIHQIGLEQAKELSARADTILRKEGYTKGTVAQRIQGLYREKKYRYPNTDAGKAKLLWQPNETYEAYAIYEIVRDRSIMRNLAAVGTAIADSAYSPSGKDAHILIDEAEAKVFQIAEAGSKNKQGFIRIDPILTETVERIDMLYSRENKNDVIGLPTGFVDLDRMTSGLQPGEMVVVAGRPSMGKTALAMNIAEHAALESKKAVAVFSMEMSGPQLAMRMIGSVGRVDQHQLRTGTFKEEDWPRLVDAVGKLNDAQLYIDRKSVV